MQRTYQKKRVGVSNERFVAGSQKGVAIAPRVALIARGRDAVLTRLEHTAPEVAEINGLGSSLNDFRDIASPQHIAFQKADLVKNTRDVLSGQYYAYRELGITVELQFDNPLPPVMADSDKIKQVVLNLCNNAVEAMPDGGYLTVKGYHIAQMVVLEISDTGTGIPEGLDVFGLFKTTKAGRTGLGLAIVQQIISAHNGTINYTTAPGHGTTFKLCLPAADSEM
jgi:signal transduction histidine kinase